MLESGTRFLGASAIWPAECPPVRVPRFNLLGVAMSAVSMAEAVSQSLDLVEECTRGYICVTGVHGIMEAQDDECFRSILNQSFLTTPDGMPTVWVGRARGFENMTRVYGPDYMLALCEAGITHGVRHFLYGGKEGVAQDLRDCLRERLPGLQIVGTYTPPFRPLTGEEERSLILMLEMSQADVLWVGLSTPKQERFMAAYKHQLPTKLMVGVGAAFDLLSGHLAEAPDWMKKTGLQWLYRLIREPKRLWRRYLINNPRFIYLLILQSLRLRCYQIPDYGQDASSVHADT